MTATVSGDGFYTDTDNETNISCYSLDSTPQAALAVHSSLLAVIVVASLLANGLVLLLVAKYKKLRCRSVIVSLSVVTADLLLTVNYTLPALVTAAFQRWPFTETGCKAFGMMSVEFLITRWLIMALLCIDRFCSVRFPFKYDQYNKQILIILTATAWLLPFLFAIPVLTGFAKGVLRENHPTCFVGCREGQRTFQSCTLFYACVFTFSFAVGCVMPIGLYAWLYWKGRKLRHSTLVLGRVSVQIASGAVVSQPIAHNFASNSREARALFTFILIFVTFFVTAMPAYLLQLIRSASLTAHCKIPIYVHFIIIELLMSSSVLDPLVIMRDRDFRTCIKRMFCCSSRTGDISSVENQSPTSNGLLNHKEKDCGEHLNGAVPNGILLDAIPVDTSVLSNSIRQSHF